MNDTFRLGRIGGVRVGVNWTVLVVFSLIAYALAAERLPRSYKGLSPIVYVLGGALTAAAFLMSLLGHELAHAIVARRNGLTVEGITLWLLGGVSRFDGEPATPGAELRIAGSGPLASLLLGVALGAASLAVPVAGVGALVTGCLAWLALINVILAGFNLVPVAPMDGGRLIHALLWRLSGDWTKATLSATQAGRAFGWATMVAGFYISLGDLGGLWLIAVGWFITTAAGLEAVQARVRGRLDAVPVRRVMTPDPFSVPAAMTAERFRRELLPRHRHAAYPVVEDGQVRGIVTAERVADAPAGTLVAALTEPAERTTADTSLAELLPRLVKLRLLVFDGDRLVGIATPSDLTRELERMARSPADGR